MTHIATQRIKKSGKFYSAGEGIVLTEAELADLPVGAAVPDDGQTELEKEPLTEEQQAVALKAAVTLLKDADFKQDGEIRAGALKVLSEGLGFEVSVEAVADAKASAEQV
tara:strand:+ start:1223 stop:1552 length:330 start_codon:yes stop_codon:yes gene_type:complete